MSQLKALREKVLTDEEFRKQLRNNPADALKSVGIQATPENLQLVKKVVSSLEELHEAFGDEDEDYDDVT